MDMYPSTAQETLVCDLHTHTLYSRDSLTALDRFLRACQRRGLDRVAVTDHNAIAGALRLKEMDPERIIVGEEIRTTHGELIAYFLTELVPAGRSPLESIERVRAQGGIVGVSHPLDPYRREAMGREKLLEIHNHLDFMEVFNARSLRRADNQAAGALADDLGLLKTGGSDAHCIWELGRGTTVMPPFDTPSSFLEGLRSAQIRGRMSPFWVHFVSSANKIARRMGWAPQPSR